MRAAWLVLLTGCSRLLDLDDPIALVDANNADAWPTDGGVTLMCTSGGDEDDDGVPDSCDTCPLEPGSPPDMDRDGIGDTCDPHPLYAVERRALLATFDDPTQYDVMLGTWTFSNGKVHSSTTNGTVSTLGIIGGPWRTPVVQASWDNATGPQTEFFVGASTYSDGAVARSLTCFLHYKAGTDELELTRTSVLLSTVQLPPQIGTGTWMTLASAALGSPPECAMVRAGASRVETDGATDPTDPTMSKVAVTTLNSVVDYRAVVIYETVYP